jgi:hypothetical protein
LLVTGWGRNGGQKHQQRSYTHESDKQSVDHFEKIFKDKTGLEWKTRKTKKKETTGKGYTYSEPHHLPTMSATIYGTQDRIYTGDETDKIRFSAPPKSKGDNFCDDNIFQTKTLR